jgi:glycosyltransferase involved in cell wall biosynthesis
MPKVSICIPAYNQVFYLRKSLASILSQTFTDYEVIITDDSSNSDVESLVGEFDFKGKLKYYHNKSPLGSPKNWNYCLSKATGQYIKILHHDDWFSNGTSLQSMVALLESFPECGLAFCGCNNLSAEGNLLFYHGINDKLFKSIETCPELLFEANLIGSPSVTLFKNPRHLAFDEHIKYLVDIEFYIRLIKTGIGMAYTTDPLVNIGHSATQVTNSVINNRREMIYEYSYTFQRMPLSEQLFSIYFETFWRLIAHLRITTIEELAEFGWTGYIPLFITNCLNGNKLSSVFKNNRIKTIVKRLFYWYSLKINHYKPIKSWGETSRVAT